MVRSIKKTIVFFLSFLLIFAMSVSAYAYEIDDVVNAAKQYISSMEGNYDSINANDNGAVSIGKVQWHGPRALLLLRTIVEANPAAAQEILGDTLYNEILTANITDWNTRCFSKEESAIVKVLLATEESKKAQDELSFNDIKGYMTRAQSMGITDGKALVYFADLENQLGSGGVTRVAKAAIEAAGSGDKVTLQVLYDAAMADSVAASSPGRRKTTYDYCASLTFGDVEAENNFGTGKYKTTASYLRIRTGPNVIYDSLPVSIPNGTTVTVTEVRGDWGKITYLGYTGWISLLYAEGIDVTPVKPSVPSSSDKPSTDNTSVAYDINGNGKLDAADARMVLRYSAHLEVFSAQQIKLADENGDGKITAADARNILLRSAKMK